MLYNERAALFALTRIRQRLLIRRLRNADTFHADGRQPEMGYDYSSCGIANPFHNFGGGRTPQLFRDP
mgnify:CR=1 FL=1